jgi:NAD(P)-dependent dehydrogenase (short-subunit alcohol dehydrogenase family)
MAMQTPAGRNGQAGDIAAAALYLASEDSAFVTGIELTVDGGFAQI